QQAPDGRRLRLAAERIHGGGHREDRGRRGRQIPSEAAIGTSEIRTFAGAALTLPESRGKWIRFASEGLWTGISALILELVDGAGSNSTFSRSFSDNVAPNLHSWGRPL